MRRTGVHRRAFTLIELLVVIAIIAVLLALLLPAVQKVREAAGNTQCKNNLKQYGIAMQMYHADNNAYPLGVNDSPRRTWVVYMWPYIEQNNLAEAYGNPSTAGGLWDDYGSNPDTGAKGLWTFQPSIYFCPSDRPGAMWTAGFNRSRGNYSVCWGNNLAQNGGGSPAVFGAVNGNNDIPTKVTMSMITDGLSNTLLMSETIVALNDSDPISHGDFMNDDLSGTTAIFMTLFQPNHGTDVMICEITSNDPAAPCVNSNTPTNPAGTAVLAARSRHAANGVNAAFCDGSVHFISSNISSQTWIALGTISAGDLPGSDW